MSITQKVLASYKKQVLVPHKKMSITQKELVSYKKNWHHTKNKHRYHNNESPLQNLNSMISGSRNYLSKYFVQNWVLLAGILILQ